MKTIFFTTIFTFFMLFALITDSGVLSKENTTLQQHTFNHQTFGLYQNMGYGITGGVKKYDSQIMGFQTNTGYRFRYEIYLCSRTQAQYGYRNVTAYGIHIFVNNQNITIAQFPYGLQGIITVDGTLIYVWETNDPTPVFNVNWQNLQ